MFRYCAKATAILIVFLASINMQVVAQDAQFSQFFATRIYTNPAFAGNTHYTRISSHMRRQWPNVQGYTTSAFYIDQSLPWINSGVGFSVFQDRQAAGGLTYSKYTGYYAYRFSLSRKLYARLGISGSYSSFNVSLSQFVFTDQLLSGSSATTDSYQFDRLQFFDFSTGGVLYTEKYWIGASVLNLNNFQNRFENPYPVKLSMHGGMLIPINKDAKGDFLKNLTIAAQYKAQQDFDQFDIGAYYGYSAVLIGLWYRGLLGLKDNETSIVNHDAIVLIGGLKYGPYRLSYSYDITISSMAGYTGGAHEVSLQIELWRNKTFKKKKYSKSNIPCPNFGGPGWQSEKK